MRAREQIIAEHPFWKRLNPHYFHSAAGHKPGLRWPTLSYLILGFEKWVRCQDEKKHAAGRTPGRGHSQVSDENHCAAKAGARA